MNLLLLLWKGGKGFLANYFSASGTAHKSKGKGVKVKLSTFYLDEFGLLLYHSLEDTLVEIEAMHTEDVALKLTSVQVGRLSIETVCKYAHHPFAPRCEGIWKDMECRFVPVGPLSLSLHLQLLPHHHQTVF